MEKSVYNIFLQVHLLKYTSLIYVTEDPIWHVTATEDIISSVKLAYTGNTQLAVREIQQNTCLSSLCQLWSRINDYAKTKVNKVIETIIEYANQLVEYSSLSQKHNHG